MLTNDVIDGLLARRSVRSYQPDLISDEELDSLLTAARYAPSAMGRQERHFTVVTNKTLLKEIGDAGDNEPFYNAPMAVIVSVPPQNPYGHDDAACAIMNLMTAANSMGISTCYIGSAFGAAKPDMMKKLLIPEGYAPVAAVIVGYGDGETKEAAPRRTDDITRLA